MLKPEGQREHVRKGWPWLLVLVSAVLVSWVLYGVKLTTP